jgi:hypothetical protein
MVSHTGVCPLDPVSWGTRSSESAWLSPGRAVRGIFPSVHLQEPRTPGLGRVLEVLATAASPGWGSGRGSCLALTRIRCPKLVWMEGRREP